MAPIWPSSCSLRNYVVHGIKRRSSSFNTGRVDHLYHDPHETSVSFHLHYGDMTDATNLIRIVQETQAGRDLQSCRAEPRPGDLRDAGIHRQCRRARHAARCSRRSAFSGWPSRRGSTRPRPRSCTATSSEIAAARNHAVLSPLALRRGKALRLLDHRELPRSLRHACLQRHPVQPRKPDARRDLRHPQDHPRRRRDPARPCRTSSISAIWTPSATGATPAIMWKACG